VAEGVRLVEKRDQGLAPRGGWGGDDVEVASSVRHRHRIKVSDGSKPPPKRVLVDCAPGEIGTHLEITEVPFSDSATAPVSTVDHVRSEAAGRDGHQQAAEVLSLRVRYGARVHEQWRVDPVAGDLHDAVRHGHVIAKPDQGRCLCSTG
jgi:hypothetical protein